MGKTTVLAWGCDGPDCNVTVERTDDTVPHGWFHAIVGKAPTTTRTKKAVYHSLPCLVSGVVKEHGQGEVLVEGDIRETDTPQ